jgi:6-pyruvoyl-tetrahydropterin synthase
MQITTRLEFNTDHRIPYHKNQYRNLHDHRYTIEITLSDDIIQQENTSENNMIMDFSDIKTITRHTIMDIWDHAFLIYQNDKPIRDFLADLPNHKTVIMNNVPTAKNMTTETFRILQAEYQDTYNNHLRLERVQLYETPNNWTDALT